MSAEATTLVAGSGAAGKNRDSTTRKRWGSQGEMALTLAPEPVPTEFIQI